MLPCITQGDEMSRLLSAVQLIIASPTSSHAAALPRSSQAMKRNLKHLFPKTNLTLHQHPSPAG
jgi:hypothetical protein